MPEPTLQGTCPYADCGVTIQFARPPRIGQHGICDQCLREYKVVAVTPPDAVVLAAVE